MFLIRCVSTFEESDRWLQRRYLNILRIEYGLEAPANTKETLEVDGVEYPLIKLEISRTSHPFYTGKSKLIDTAGRIDKFKTRYAKFKK